MSRRGAVQALAFAALVGVAAAPYLARRTLVPHDDDAPSPGEAEAIRRHGVFYREVSKEIGVSFRHEPMDTDPRLEHIRPQVAGLGASVSVCDFDRDGLPDLYATTNAKGRPNALFRNTGEGRFEDVAARVGLADLNREEHGASMASVWVDLDGDGFEEVLVCRWGRTSLYRNEGGERFEEVRVPALPAHANILAATALDFDGDGRLDLYLGGYYPEDVDLRRLRSTRMMPESFEYAKNGGRAYLLRNLGDLRFEDVTEAAGAQSRRWTVAILSCDLDDDGDPDLFCANDYGVSELFVNEGGRFVERGGPSGIGRTPKSGMCAAAGDVLNQGRLAIYETNISEEGILLQGNNLWMPSGARGLAFENAAASLGVEQGGWSWGAQIGDLTNDGAMDLVCVNGFVSADPERSYWYPYSEIASAHGAIIGDARNWPPMEGRSLAGYQRTKVWLGDGAGRFLEVSRAVGLDEPLDGRAVALADLDGRGALWVITANQSGPLQVWRPSVDPANAWVAFDLVGRPPNPSAVGARVRLEGRPFGVQMQERVVASGFAAQNEARLHFGLGRDARIDRAIIRWPSGREQALTDLEPRKVHRIEEPRGAARTR